MSQGAAADGRAARPAERIGRRRFLARLIGRSGAALAAAGALLQMSGCAAMGDRVTAAEPHSEGGIGGTGIEQVAVLGSVTGFGSLLINGVTVDLPEGLSVASVLGDRPAAEIALGEILAVRAIEAGPGRFEAVSATALVALVGPVTSRPGAPLRVMGARVDLPGATTQALSPGARVAVSGFWRGPRLIATRLTRAPDGAANHVFGDVRRDAAGAPYIGGVKLAPRAAVPRLGVAALLSGAWGAEGFAPARAEVLSPRALLGAPTNRVSIEGYARAGAAGGGDIDGFGLRIDPGARLGQIEDGRAVVIGAFESDGAGLGEIAARHGVRLPEDLPGRRAALDGLGDPFAPDGAAELRGR